jgi:toxin ParE2
MKIRLLEIAQQELDESIEYYNTELPELGDKFLKEFLSSLDRIGQYPDAWHPYSKRTRRCLFRRFPFGLIYQILKDEILIIAVANLHRKPEYWKERLYNKDN